MAVFLYGQASSDTDYHTLRVFSHCRMHEYEKDKADRECEKTTCEMQQRLTSVHARISTRVGKVLQIAGSVTVDMGAEGGVTLVTLVTLFSPFF